MTNQEFINKVKTRLITEEEIRTYLLSLSKKEFIELICLKDNNQETKDKDIERMIENHISIIQEFFEEITIEERLKTLPLISEDFYIIKEMFFNTLPIETITEVYLSNPEKYTNYVSSYITDTSESLEKDELICLILTDPSLYKNFKEEQRAIFKSLLCDAIVILDERYNLCNITYDEIKNEVARYLANIEYKKSSSINRGIHNKVSSKNLYQIFLEVNKGLKRIDSPQLTEEEILDYLDLSFPKAVLFLNECMTLTEEDILNILKSNYKDESSLIGNKSLDHLLNIIEDYNLPEVDLIR